MINKYQTYIYVPSLFKKKLDKCIKMLKCFVSPSIVQVKFNPTVGFQATIHPQINAQSQGLTTQFWFNTFSRPNNTNFIILSKLNNSDSSMHREAKKTTSQTHVSEGYVTRTFFIRRISVPMSVMQGTCFGDMSRFGLRKGDNEDTSELRELREPIDDWWITLISPDEELMSSSVSGVIASWSPFGDGIKWLTYLLWELTIIQPASKEKNITKHVILVIVKVMHK